MVKCHTCQKELTDEEKDEGYETVFRCSQCGAMNYFPVISG